MSLKTIYLNSQELKKAKKIKFCSYCQTPKEKDKLIKCEKCQSEFCIKCLTDIGNKRYLCNDCIIRYIREDVILIIEK